jgi:hypothetical protein
MMNASSLCAAICAAFCVELLEVPPAYALCVAACYSELCTDPPTDLLAADNPVLLTDKDFGGDCSCVVSESAIRDAAPLFKK